MRVSRSPSLALTNSRAVLATISLSKRAPQFVEQRLVAEDVAGLEQGGADGHVGLRLADAFVDRAGRMADLLAQVPQDVEDRLDDALAPWGLLVGQQEQEVDVGAGRERGASVAADRRDAEPLGRGGPLERVDEAQHVILDRAEQFVLQMREAGRTGQSPMIPFEICRDAGAARCEHVPKTLDDGAPEGGIVVDRGPQGGDLGVEAGMVEAVLFLEVVFNSVSREGHLMLVP